MIAKPKSECASIISGLLVLCSFVPLNCGKVGPKNSDNKLIDNRSSKESADGQVVAGDDLIKEKNSSEAQILPQNVSADAEGADGVKFEVSGTSGKIVRHAEQEITLQYLGKASEKSLLQERQKKPVEETFKQSSLLEKTQIFHQASAGSGLLDILLVVDNSGSMGQEQTNLATKLNPLLSSISATDWRIGIVSTDPSGLDRNFTTTADNCMHKIIKKGDAHVELAFQTAINELGLSGSGDEVGIDMAITGIKGECTQGLSWVRPGSAVAVIIVSDEDNCSNGAICQGADQLLVDYLKSIRPPTPTKPSNARVYGIIGYSTPYDALTCPYANKGNLYASAVTKTSGIIGDICAADYSNVLQSISQDITTLLEKKFTLSETAYGSPQVFVNDTEVPTTKYTFIGGKEIAFTTEPPVGAEIKVVYKVKPTDYFKEVTIKEIPVLGSLEIFLDGISIADAGYTYEFDALARKVIFNKYPKDLSTIVVKYKIEGELPSSVSIDEKAIASSLKVFVDGVLQDAKQYEYKAENHTLVFVLPPAAGAQIKYSFMTMVDNINLKFEIDRNKFLQTDKILVIEKESQKIVNEAKIDFPLLILPPEVFAEGKVIVVRLP